MKSTLSGVTYSALPQAKLAMTLHPDGTMLQGIAALIGAIVAAAGALGVAFRSQAWVHAFRANLDLVAERDTLSAMNKRLVAETMATLASATSWESSYRAIEKTQQQMQRQLDETRRQLHASTRYIHALYLHGAALEQRMNATGVKFDDIKLPAPPPELEYNAQEDPG